MTPASNASTQLLGAIAAATLLAGTAASAQTIASPISAAPTAGRGKAGAARQTGEARQTGQASRGANEGARARHRLLGDQHRYRSIPRQEADPGAGAPGRVPLQGAPGSVGFASGSVRTGRLVDGRASPGLERYNQDPQSYAGVSLSLTNSNKSFPFPTQLLPHNQW